MAVTADEVQEAYRMMLRRLPESQAATDFHTNAHASVRELYIGLSQTDEFLLSLRNDRNTPLTGDHLAFLRLFVDPARKPMDGFVVDFLGVKTACRFHSWTTALSGYLDCLPVPHNVYGFSLYEWIGSLRAVAEASGRLTAIELGAGWGPWLIACARAVRARGIVDIDLVGVEGDDTHFAFMLEHFANNGEDPKLHQLMHGVVAPFSGAALFPIEDDPVYAWGQEPKFFPSHAAAEDALARANGRHQVLDAFSLAEIIGDRPRVDLIHIDIQGSEAELVEANPDLISQRVARLVIGTHGRDIELRLHRALQTMGWVCEFERAWQYAVPGFTLVEDGTQVWRNDRLRAK